MPGLFMSARHSTPKQLGGTMTQNASNGTIVIQFMMALFVVVIAQNLVFQPLPSAISVEELR